MVKSYMKLDGNLVPISVGTVGTTSKEEQTKTVTDPNFANGNVVVTPDVGKVLTQVTVIKDNDLVPEKIVKDVNIFGVVGIAEPAKEEQTKTVTDPNFSSGNVVVTPDSGKVLTQVTVVKDIDLVPENIVKDVNIFGVVGTAETGGSTLPKLATPVFHTSYIEGIGWLATPNATMYKVYYGGTPTKASPFVSTSLLSVSASGTYDNTYRILNEKNVAVSAVAEGFLESDLSPSRYIQVCLIEGTAITLADRTTKNIEDITYDDNLLVWDFDNATFTGAKPIWIMKQKRALEYNHLVFSDGSELNTVNQHRIFNVEKGMFTYPMTDDTPLGTTTFNDKGEYITLISKEIINREVVYYNVITDYHMNLFAGTILTSCRLSNIYPIEKMKYQKDNRELHDASMFNELDDKWVSGLRLLEQPLEINRDNSVVFENSLVDYVKRLEESRLNGGVVMDL